MWIQVGYGTAVFVSAACGLVIEIVAGRLLAPYVGMSLYTWTAVIAVVLAGLSAGHWIGGRLATDNVDSRRSHRRVAAALGLAALSTLLSLILLRTLAATLAGQGLSPIMVILTLATGAFLLPSLFVGIVAPMLTKLAIDARPGGYGPTIGRMYALGALGSIAGTLAAGYVFISWIGSTATIITVAVVYAALAVAFAAGLAERIAMLGLLAFAGALMLVWGGKIKAFASPCRIESDYYCIRVDDFRGQGSRLARLMALDHLVHSINDRDDADLLHSPYVQFVDEIARVRLGESGDRSAFFIGGGGLTLPRTWAARGLATQSVVAEIDPAVTRAARQFMWVGDALEGTRITHEDARVALQRLERDKKFHVVFGDAFHDISVPPHLVTLEFHEQIKARLLGQGFYIVNVVDAGANPRFLFSLVKTLRRTFPVVEVWQEEGQFRALGRVTYTVLATASPTSTHNISARRGFGRRWTRWPAVRLDKALRNTALPVLTDDFAPVDRLMMPILLAPDQGF
jgi:spermidine synthase